MEARGLLEKKEEIAQPSITALSVACGVLLCAKSEEWTHLVSDDSMQLTEHLINTALKEYKDGIGSSVFRFGSLFPYSMQQFFLESGTPEGYLQHCAMRKLFIEQTVKKFIERKDVRTQVVILGGGFDTLALRLHKDYPETEFFELDRGRTREIKLGAVRTLPYASVNEHLRRLGDNIHFVEADLANHTWLNTLTMQQQFSREKQTIVVAEGLTMYLSYEQILKLLNSVKYLINNKGDMIVSFMEPTHHSSYISQMFRSEAKESYSYRLEEQHVAALAQKYGFQLIGKILSIDFQYQAGNKAAEMTYLKSPEKLALENYFLLRSTEEFNEKQEVEKMKVDVPYVRRIKEISSGCVIS